MTYRSKRLALLSASNKRTFRLKLSAKSENTLSEYFDSFASGDVGRVFAAGFGARHWARSKAFLKMSASCVAVVNIVIDGSRREVSTALERIVPEATLVLPLLRSLEERNGKLDLFSQSNVRPQTYLRCVLDACPTR